MVSDTVIVDIKADINHLGIDKSQDEDNGKIARTRKYKNGAPSIARRDCPIA